MRITKTFLKKWCKLHMFYFGSILVQIDYSRKSVLALFSINVLPIVYLHYFCFY